MSLITLGPSAAIIFIIDGDGVAITPGEKGHIEIPFACIIEGVTMLADRSGSIVVDIWKNVYGSFPPSNTDSITSSTPPTINAARNSQNSTLIGWRKALAVGDILAFNVNSCTDITRVTINLKIIRSE